MSRLQMWRRSKNRDFANAEEIKKSRFYPTASLIFCIDQNVFLIIYLSQNCSWSKKSTLKKYVNFEIFDSCSKKSDIKYLKFNENFAFLPHFKKIGMSFCLIF